MAELVFNSNLMAKETARGITRVSAFLLIIPVLHLLLMEHR